jgi:hypothetical protein
VLEILLFELSTFWFININYAKFRIPNYLCFIAYIRGETIILNDGLLSESG